MMKFLSSLVLLLSVCAGIKTQYINTGWPVNLEYFLQPDDVDNGMYDYINTDDGKLCARDCTEHSSPRTCYYKFTIEQYHTMGPACLNCTTNFNDCFSPQCVPADGIEKTILTVNRKLSGPTIQVCVNDRIIVDVLNKMPAKSLTIHWHGIEQIGKPWMDGVSNLSQCPIDEGQTFRYDFIADASGTHFWHAHTGLLMYDGIQGTLIVRESMYTEKQWQWYDYDLYSHAILIQDWIHWMADNKYPGYNADKQLAGNAAETYLINGHGRYKDPETGESTTTPFAVFNVEPNSKYRFRIIGGTSATCSCAFAVEGHPLLLIATDGRPVVPIVVGSVVLSAGEMFDVVIETDQAPKSYWIRVQGFDECETAYQSAILRYSGSEELEPKTESSASIITALELPQVNNPRYGCDGSNPMYTCLDNLISLIPIASNLFKPDPDARFILSAGAHIFTVEELYQNNTFHRHYLPSGGPKLGGTIASDTFNHLSGVFPPFPILTQDEDIPAQMRCPTDTSKCVDQICECVNIIKVKINDVVEFVVTDDILNKHSKFMHPIHLHGHRFLVIKQGSYEERQKPDFYKNAVDSNRPVIKHTVGIPDDGFVVLRFLASNPGFWFFHCHFLFHGHLGMSLIVQVGDRTEFPRAPENFPRCGDYLPPVFLQSSHTASLSSLYPR